jgi:hypothetical protein
MKNAVWFSGWSPTSAAWSVVACTTRKDVWVLNTRCRYCDEPCHVVVFLRLVPESKPPTDLTPDEAQDLSGLPPISSDDVLDMHELLQGFEGDIEILFNR